MSETIRQHTRLTYKPAAHAQTEGDLGSYRAHSLTQRQALREIGAWIDQRGWCPATGGNFSSRFESEECVFVITRSGVHKGMLAASDFIEVDRFGAPLCAQAENRPSAETLIHAALYRLSDEIGAVLHIHSVSSTVLSRIELRPQLSLSGWEMQKALAGERTHEETVSLEIFDNRQEIDLLAREVEARWHQRGGLRWGLLVRGHGMYVWGRDLVEARRHLEAIEFLLACHLEHQRLHRER